MTHNYTIEDLIGRVFKTGTGPTDNGYFIKSFNKRSNQYRLMSFDKNKKEHCGGEFGHSADSILDPVNRGSWVLEPVSKPEIINDYQIY